MNIEKIIEEFYLTEFKDCTNLVIKSEFKSIIKKMQNRLKDYSIGCYDVITKLDCVIPTNSLKKQYKLTISFDRIY